MWWLVGGGGGLIAFFAMGVYLARTNKTHALPLYGVGLSAITVGIVTADFARFALPTPQPALALAGTVLATVGFVLLVRAVNPSWKPLLCDTYLVTGAPVIGALSIALAWRTPVGGASAELDIISAALTIFCATVLARMAAVVPVSGPADRVMMTLFGVARSLAWVAAAADAAGWFSTPRASWLIASLVSCALAVAVQVRLSLKRIQPIAERTEHGSGAQAYLVTMGVTVVVLGVMGISPGIVRWSLLVLGGIAICALIVRILVTVGALEDAKALVEERERFFRNVVQASSDVILISSPTGTLEYASPVAERTLGSGATPGRDVWTLLGIDPDAVTTLPASDDDDPLVVEGNRGRQVLEASIARRDDKLVISARDVTERAALRQTLHRLAYHDPLTDLPNRLQLIDRVDAMIATRAPDEPFSVLFVDLDRFKHINDASGHAVGDDVLRQVAIRLDAAVGDGLLARLGGDEFVLVHMGSPDDAQVLAERIGQDLSRPFEVGGRSYRIGASTGIAPSVDDADAHELLRRADLAMYRAKRTRTSWSLYEARLAEAALARVDTESEVAEALRGLALRMYLQPLVRTGTVEVRGCEALLRWVRRDGTVQAPVDMLAFAEHTHQLGTITRWMLEAAAQRLAHDAAFGGAIAVNVPPVVLATPDLVGELVGLLDRYDLAPERIHLEITEEAMVAHGDHGRQAIARLRGLGFRIVVDDFGTGFSSLSYLARLPVDGIKIDRSFVEGLDTGRAARSVVRGLVGVTRELGIDLVAEGVETRRQHEILVELGVPLAQGFWYARPEDSRDLDDLTRLTGWASGHPNPAEAR